MRVRYSKRTLFVVMMLLLQVSPTWGVQVQQSNEPIPSWLVWRAFYDSLAFYGKRTANQDTRIVSENFSLTPVQASALLSAGRSFLGDVQRIDEEAKLEAAKRYKYAPAQTGPPSAGSPKQRKVAPPKSIRERALEDGLYAQVEAKKQAALANHMKALRLDIGSPKVDQINTFVEISIAPHIKRHAEPLPGTGNTGLPPGVTRESAPKGR